MSTTQKVLLSLALLLTAFAIGRYTVPEKVKIEEKVVFVEKKEVEKKTDREKKKHVVTTTKEIKTPDGTITTVVVVDEKTDTSTSTETKEKTDSSTVTEKSKTVEAGRNKVTISVLAGLNVFDLKQPVVYGGHVSRPLLGPITVGLWGMSTGVGGVSIGLQF